MKKFLCILLLFSILLPGTVMAASEVSYDTYTEAERIDLINSLNGQEISIGEFYDIVWPEYMKSLRKDQKDSLYNDPMVWPEDAPVEETTGVASSSFAQSSSYYGIEAVSYYCTFNHYIGRSGTKINFSASNYMILPTSSTKIPSMSATAYLYDGNGKCVAIAGPTYKYNVSSVVSSSYYYGTSGKKYRVNDIHHVTFPANAFPQNQAGSYWTSYVTIP